MGQSSHRAQSLKEQLTIKLYLDEMVPTDLARVLRQYGYDVVTAQEAGMLGKTDVEHLEYASHKEGPSSLLILRISRSCTRAGIKKTNIIRGSLFRQSLRCGDSVSCSDYA
jgi:uncharacterized protein with PIN domain